MASPALPPAPKECGYLGFPSDDSRIRMYSQTECETLGGSFAANGECLRKEGGSFSWDCRAVNDDTMAKVYAYRYHIAVVAAIGGYLYYRNMKQF